MRDQSLKAWPLQLRVSKSRQLTRRSDHVFESSQPLAAGNTGNNQDWDPDPLGELRHFRALALLLRRPRKRLHDSSSETGLGVKGVDV